MTAHPTFKAFNFHDWIARNKGALKPPVANKQLFDHKTGMTVMIVGGPNRRVDFHDDPVEEFFYQLEGDMVLKIAEGGKIYDVNIRQGDVFILPPHVRHSPQRPVAGSVGLVVEGTRTDGMRDGFEWFCFTCGERVHRSATSGFSATATSSSWSSEDRTPERTITSIQARNSSISSKATWS